MYDSAAFSSLFNINDSRKLFVVNHNQVNCVARRVSVRSNDSSDRMTNEVNFVCGEHAMIWNFQIGQSAGARHRPNSSRHILA